ncbi:MAG TPA: DUF5990 family protein [Gemmatimonadales bacterium]|nr:DUF5990 family protein [Gemmatimonadales bacterium]
MREVRLRIVVDDPVPGIVLRLQRGKDELVEATSESAKQVRFDFTARIGTSLPNGAPNFLGPFTQGPPALRFVYIRVGRSAGQSNTEFDRRAKIPLGGISNDLLARALANPDSVLEVHMPGRGKDGTPTCATVKLPPGAWRRAGSVG